MLVTTGLILPQRRGDSQSPRNSTPWTYWYPKKLADFISAHHSGGLVDTGVKSAG